MEEINLLKRLSDLECEVHALQAHTKVGETRLGFWRRIQASIRFLLAYWVLGSFLVTVLIAVYVKHEYKVDYLESYKNIGQMKQLSNFYKEMGDRMMAKSEWQAAEQAYRAALHLNPNNMNATYGVVKAQVFQPIEGERYYPGEVVDSKLVYLDKIIPGDEQVYFLKSVRLHDMQKDGDAESELVQCINKYPESFVSHFNLGYIHQSQFRISEAVINYSKAVQLDANSAFARDALGFALMLSLNFPKAIEELMTSNRISPMMVTQINLGDAYRYSESYENARMVHQFVIDQVEKEEAPELRYVGSEWLYNFMPLYPGDVQTIKARVQVNSLEQKKAIAHFALSIDLALLTKFGKATKEFDAALKLERSWYYRQFFQNKMLSVENLMHPPDDVKAWLKQHRMSLDQSEWSVP
jgi:tetratricopeptide (TPR) repeat protein